MKTNQIIRNFSPNRYKDADLAVKAGEIVLAMTNNSHFPSPQPALSVIEAACKDYEGLLAKGNRATPTEIVIKKRKRLELESLLQQLAEYVKMKSQGNEEILSSSGFDRAQKPAKVGLLPRPEKFKVAPGDNPGCIKLSCDRIPQAKFYEFTYTEAPLTPQSAVHTHTTTRSKTQITGLISGKQYIFRVAAVGTHPSRNWSNEVVSYVL